MRLALDDPFLSQNLRELCASYFQEQILPCEYTIFYVQILVASQIPRVLFSPPNCASPKLFLGYFASFTYYVTYR